MKNIEELTKYLCDNNMHETIMLDNYDFSMAVIGVTFDKRLIYDYRIMIDILFESGNYTVEEAIEYIYVECINTLSQIENALTPLIVDSSDFC